jgi:hypothetical protein
MSTKKRASFHPKKVPPPTPDGREGRLFPPEQSSKAGQLLAELKGCRNKILSESDGHDRAFTTVVGRVQRGIDDFGFGRNFGCESVAFQMYSLRSPVVHVLILYARYR